MELGVSIIKTPTLWYARDVHLIHRPRETTCLEETEEDREEKAPAQGAARVAVHRSDRRRDRQAADVDRVTHRSIAQLAERWSPKP